MKAINVLLFLFLSHICFSQQYNYFEGPTSLEAIIDTAQGQNSWQIGPPQKTLFNEALTAPNVIITDTVNNYPSSDTSSFMVRIEGYSLFSYPYMIMLFSHKMDVDEMHAGGWIEASYDEGNTWANIYTDSVNGLFVLDYSPMDTLFNGEIGFASSNTDWNLSAICWGVLDYTWPPPSSILVRFNFASDSMSVAKEGWMIDNMEVYPEIIHTVEELRDMTNGEALVAYPNPMNDQLNFLYRLDSPSSMVLNIIGMDGKLLYRKDYGRQAKGIYTKRITTTDFPNLPPHFVIHLELENRRLVQRIIKL